MWRAAALLLLMSSGCALGRARTVPKVTHGAFCTVGAPRGHSGRVARGDLSAEAVAARSPGFPLDVLRTAAAVGALEHLERLDALVRSRAPLAEQELVRQQAVNAVTLATLDVAGAVALLDCEAERARSTSAALQSAEADQSEAFTVAGLGLGGLAALVGGVLGLAVSDPLPAGIAALAGGLLEAGASVAAAASQYTGEFLHPVNPIAEVWSGTDHPSFPDAVWLFLEDPEGEGDGRSARQSLREAWRTSEKLGVDEASDALLLGQGGVHGARTLAQRAVMLTELRAVVALFQQELDRLLRAILRGPVASGADTRRPP